MWRNRGGGLAVDSAQRSRETWGSARHDPIDESITGFLGDPEPLDWPLPSLSDSLDSTRSLSQFGAPGMGLFRRAAAAVMAFLARPSRRARSPAADPPPAARNVRQPPTPMRARAPEPSASTPPGGERSVWRRPMRSRDRRESHRGTTPLELLFDLCFAVAVSHASAHLHEGIAGANAVHA